MAESVPTIYISSVSSDDSWRDRVRDALLAATTTGKIVDIRWRLDDLDDWPPPNDGSAASVPVVVLVSQQYLASSRARKELRTLVDGTLDGSVTVHWILLDEAPWNSTPLSSIQSAWDVSRPLSTMSESDLEAAMATIARKVLAAMGVELRSGVGDSPGKRPVTLDEDLMRRLGPEGLDVLSLAEAIRIASGVDWIHVEHLVYALFASPSPAMRERLIAAGIKEPADLAAFLRSRTVQLVIPAEVPRLTREPALSEHAHAAVVRAAALADRHGGVQAALADRRGGVPIDARHLTHGLLSLRECGIVKPLLELGVENPAPPLIRAPSSPPRSPAVGSPPYSLSRTGSPPASPVSGSPAGSPGAGRAVLPGAAGFTADTVAGEDRLDVRREALTLAMVVAHQDVEPPISVGLFGDWGSGKSFFMSEMRTWIRKLGVEARERQRPFCQELVQLEFNAWHYMDTNLWASLTREIFEGLATAVADKNTEQAALLERERLRKATRSTKDVLAAKELEIGDKERALADTDRRLSELQARPPSTADVAGAALQAALEVPEVQRPLRQAARELHLDEAGRTAEELKKELDELGALARLGKAVAIALRENWTGLLLGLAAVAAVLLGIRWLAATELPPRLERALAAIGTAIAAVASLRKKVSQVLTRVSTFKDTINTNLKEQTATKAKEITESRQKQSEELGALRQQKTQAEQDLAGLRKSLENLDDARKLVDFIRQRDASSDYRDQLGVVARASQDFKRLNELMARAAVARKKRDSGEDYDEDDAKLPYIERIVLYIDDLDRCPRDKVVDVLQAVHLLLAYRLFVVVVGVDPRWLLHSLEQHNGAFRSAAEASEDRSPESASWRSTSLNYLEKIFQIPYTLRPMEDTGFKNLITDLASPQARSGPAPRPAPPASPVPVPPLVDPSPGAVSLPPRRAVLAGISPLGPAALPRSPAGAVVTATTPAAPPATPAVLDLNPAALVFDPRERDFMPFLFELIPTPRAAKRFVNVYRLLRASIATEDELRWFVEGREFVAVQILLAMITGAPAEASEILRELLAQPAKAAWNLDWWKLVDSVVTPREEQSGWRALKARLRSLRERTDVPRTCESFRKWADDVARYSFYSGRVVLGPQPYEKPHGATPGAGRTSPP